MIEINMQRHKLILQLVKYNDSLHKIVNFIKCFINLLTIKDCDFLQWLKIEFKFDLPFFECTWIYSMKSFLFCTIEKLMIKQSKAKSNLTWCI